jgi:hypothetical protein
MQSSSIKVQRYSVRFDLLIYTCRGIVLLVEAGEMSSVVACLHIRAADSSPRVIALFAML